jgi:hypothetical protein
MPRRPPFRGAPTVYAFGDVIRVLEQRCSTSSPLVPGHGATAALTVFLHDTMSIFSGLREQRSEITGTRRPMDFDNPTVAVEMLNRCWPTSP